MDEGHLVGSGPAAGRTRGSVVFLLLAFVPTWILQLALLATGMDVTDDADPRMLVAGGVSMLMPALAAVLVQKVVRREPLVGHLALGLRPDRWLVVAWLAPALLALPTLCLGAALSGQPVVPGLSQYAAKLPAQVTINTLLVSIFAAGEEIGWRGFLWSEWRHHGFWRASTAIGVLWAIWHAPLILAGYNYPGHPGAGMLLFVGVCVLEGNVLAFLRERTGSVWPAAIFHGAWNCASVLAVAGLSGPDPLVQGSIGLAGLPALLLANLGVLMATRSRRGSPVASATGG